MTLVNLLFDTQPAAVHAQGHHRHKPHWLPIKEAFFDEPSRTLGRADDVAVLTCNNGHDAMGMAERSFEHLGLEYTVCGRGVDPWVNSRDKPRAIVTALEAIDSDTVLYLDSRDALLLADPAIVARRFREEFAGAHMVFGADRMNWPPLREFARFEEGLAADHEGDFQYLNGGLWIAERDFALDFFREAMETEPVEEAPESEQGILKQLFPRHHPDVRLDYRCALFQNIGFVSTPILEIRPS